jgi:hypothetical protein
MYYFVTSYYFKRACENHAISENYYNKEKTKINQSQQIDKIFEFFTEINNLLMDIID